MKFNWAKKEEIPEYENNINEVNNKLLKIKREYA